MGDIVEKCRSIYHRTIKLKLVDVKPKPYIKFNKENNYKDPEFIKLVIIWEKYQNIKTLLQKVTFQIVLKSFLLLKRSHSKLVQRSFCYWKVKNKVPQTYLIDHNGEEIVGTFMKKG